MFSDHASARWIILLSLGRERRLGGGGLFKNGKYLNNYNKIKLTIQCHQKLIPTKSDLVTSILIAVNIKVFGGEAGPAATLAPKLGPLGLNAKKVGEDIVKEGGKWKGIRVMVQLKCQNRAAEITVQPTSSALVIKELGGYERDRKKTKNVTHKGNLTLEQVKKIAKAI
jgi:ribosomal protein L11